MDLMKIIYTVTGIFFASILVLAFIVGEIQGRHNSDTVNNAIIRTLEREVHINKFTMDSCNSYIIKYGVK